MSKCYRIITTRAVDGYTYYKYIFEDWEINDYKEWCKENNQEINQESLIEYLEEYRVDYEEDFDQEHSEFLELKDYDNLINDLTNDNSGN